jgi:hypothetical protein
MSSFSRLLSSCVDEWAAFHTCPESAPQCPFRSNPKASESEDRRLRCVRFATADAAATRLQGMAGHAGHMVTLRQLVSKTPGPLAWMSDHHVIALVAQMVVSRRLCLLAESRVARGAELTAAAAPPPPRLAGVTPSRLRAPRPETAIFPSPIVPEFTQDLNQAAQAAALELAAASGVPFCEVCEKARQQAAQ